MLVRNKFIVLSITVPVATLVLAKYWPPAYWLFVLFVPIILLGLYDLIQRKHTILRLYPVIGHMRYVFEFIRPEIQQYFVESDTNGHPINREFRALVYQRSKGERDTRPFGTLFDLYRSGYEWINHSLAPKTVSDNDPRIRIGGKDCQQPYESSPLNISAMSFGALSKNAIEALNKGAQLGGFSHNTGEGGISPYHLKHDGDLVWQIGTAYFGCRDAKGNFDEELFAQKSSQITVKMIEIKLSQGAKPGHGGILPAIKLTKEIAEIRHVPMGFDVISPPSHSTFSTPTGLLTFIKRLRDLSGGKPVGFKLCVGNKPEFLAICKAMLETKILPDFITIDGGEGGTGAAPIELTNSVGMPLRDGLVFVNNALIGVGLRDHIRLIASGKVMSAFHMLRLHALGADIINSARAMMFALGCIQSRHCNQDTCPTGIATQNPTRSKALDIEHKSTRVANYHASMIRHLVNLVASAGLNSLSEIKPRHINHRIKGIEIKNFEELYPNVEKDFLISDKPLPDDWKKDWDIADPNTW